MNLLNKLLARWGLELRLVRMRELKMYPSIMLYSGKYFDFLRPSTCDITIEDIAHALSHICRFTGHTNTHYSVAQHCVIGSHHMDTPYLSYEFLLHDAAEAVLGDVASPLKQLLRDYHDIEAQVERSLWQRFGLGRKLSPETKRMDMIMLLTERISFMHNVRDSWACTQGVEPLPYVLEAWTPAQAKAEFLKRYYELKGQL